MLLSNLYLLLFSAPVRTWVIGDSIICQAGDTDAQLPSGGVTLWKGTPGQKIAGLRNKVNQLLIRHPYPTTVILHVETCDIFNDTTANIRGRVEENVNNLPTYFQIPASFGQTFCRGNSVKPWQRQRQGNAAT